MPAAKKKILIISLSNLAKEPRVLRQVSALAGNFRVITLGTAPIDRNDVEFIKYDAEQEKQRYVFHHHYPLPLRKLVSLFINLFVFYKFSKQLYLRKTARMSHQLVYDLCAAHKPDVVIAHGLDLLPVAFRIAGDKGKVVLDAHEYYPLEFEDKPEWLEHTKPYYDLLCNKYLTRVHLMYNICKGIADEYEKNFGVKSVIITNATEYKELAPVETKDTIRLVHHGIAIRSRKLELMLDIMDHLEARFELYLMLVNTDKDYYQELVQRAASNPRIHFLGTVPTHQIPDAINRFDMGLVFVPPVNFNYRFGLGNKFFEFIQARIAQAIGPLPEMAAYVNQYDLGFISATFEPKEFAEKLNKVTPAQVNHYKQKTHENAFALSGEANKQAIYKTIAEIAA